MTNRIKYVSFLFFILIAIFNSNDSFAIPNKINFYAFYDSLIKKNTTNHFVDPIISTDSSTCIIPFTMAGNLILIWAKADTTEGNFILDTGAPGLVLNITYFRDYPDISSSNQEQLGICGPAEPRIQTEVEQFNLGPIKYNRVEADMINLGHIENIKGVKILGLLGVQLFKQFEMIIDYEKNLIYLHLISKKEKKTYQSNLLEDTTSYSIAPFDITDNRLITHLEIAGKKLCFIIDCAAETSVLDSRLSEKIYENVVFEKSTKLAGANDKETEVVYGKVNNLKVGNQNVNSLPVIITNLDKSCFSAVSCTDGILGFDFLSLHKKIGFSFVNHKMYIWK